MAANPSLANGHDAPRRVYEPETLDLTELLGILRRRALLLSAVVGVALLAAAAVILLVTPQYRAEVLLLIESDGAPRIVTLESVVSSLSGDEESVRSQAHILASRSLTARVVDELDLLDDPEFAASEPLSEQAARSAVIDAFQDRLDVVPLEDSRIIAVRFRSENSEKAALIANTLADAYLNARLESKYELTAKANSWMSTRIAELRDDLAASEAEVERARGEYGLLEGNGATLSSQELTELNTQLVIARSARAEAEARLAQVELASSGGSAAETTFEVLQSQLIQRLREQEAQVQRRVAELSSELGPRHPRMVQLRAEAADLQSRIETEVNKIVAGLRNQVSVARAREDSLEESLEGLKSQAAETSQNEILLRALEREADANRTLLNTLLARQKETISQEDQNFQQADASIVSRADAPVEPAYPQTAIVLGLALIGGVIVGVLAVLFAEVSDRGLRSGEQMERAIGLGAIGFVPKIADLGDYKTYPGYLAGEIASVFRESVRNVYWSLKLASPDKTPQTLLVTSSVSGEGKTVLASCLATVQSMAGQRVLLIDADVRQPGVHLQTEIDREPGLTNVLAGSATIDDALVEREWSSLTVLPAGMPTPNAPNLLGSKAMQELLSDLKERFDLIVIDSPPVMAATDARILAQLADVTLLLAKWGATARPVVRAAATQLETAGAPLVVGLLTLVDMKRNESYGYGDSTVYGEAVSSYHTA